MCPCPWSVSVVCSPWPGCGDRLGRRESCGLRPGRRCVSRLSSLRRVCAGGRVRPVMGERVWKRFHQQCKRVARSRPAVKGGAPPMGRAGHGGRSRTRSRKGGVERRGRGRCRGRGGPGLSGARECSRTGETVGGLLRQVRGTRRVSGLDVSARSSWGGLWCGWGSWGEPGRGRVRICCKGVSRQDRPREEARNINDSLPASRRDPGLCNRFGQPAPPRAPRVGPSLAGWRPRRAPRRASTSLNPRERLLEVRARGLSDVLGGYPAISRAGSGRTGTVGWRWESRKGVGNGAAPGGVAHGGLESRKGVRNGEATGRRGKEEGRAAGAGPLGNMGPLGDMGLPGGGSGGRRAIWGRRTI